MAIISPDTFDPLRRYVAVRLQQGVPIVDADWNEQDDIRRFEVRTFLKWFVGDGIPVGNDDAFAVVGTGATDDFTIAAGAGPLPGRCLVDGLDVFIAADTTFRGQPLHEEQAGAAQLAADWGVPVIGRVPDPPAPGSEVELTVYLDVWERLVTPEEEPDLVHPGLGTESCARLRREWAVRVQPGSAVPTFGDSDHLAGHSYSALASLRQDDSGALTADRVTDLRRRRVGMPSFLDTEQMLIDAFGSGYAVDGSGQPRLPFSLRDIINAILRDGRPALLGPDIVLDAGEPVNFPTSTLTDDGTQMLFWTHAGAAPGTQVLAFQRRSAAGWSAPEDAFQLTGLTWDGIAVTAQPGGVIRVFYSALVGNWRLLARRFFDGVWEPEETIASADDNHRPVAVTGAAGNALLVWRRESGGVFSLRSTLIPPVGAAPPDVEAAASAEPTPQGVALSPGDGDSVNLYAVHDPGGGADWVVRSKRWEGGAWQPDTAYQTVVDIPVTGFLDFTAGLDSFGAHWLVWTTQSPPSGSVLQGRRVLGSDVSDVREWLRDSPRYPSLIRDSQDNLQIFFSSDGNNRIGVVNLVYSI